jgi:DNA-directed RNA polymerase alpha subunit
MITQEKYEEALKIVNDYLNQDNSFNIVLTKFAQPQFPINDISRRVLSYRAYNVLKERVKVNYLSDLEGMKKSDFFKYRSIGPKTYDEIQTCCNHFGITLIDDSILKHGNIIFNNQQL